MYHLHISKENQEKITACIEQAEKKTTGEIVPAIVSSSHHYHHIWLEAAVLSCFILTAILYLTVDYLYVYEYFIAEIIFCIVGFLLVQIPFVFRLFASKKELSHEVHMRAFYIFHSHGLSNTKDRTGILIFVSKLEHMVVILGDEGIHNKVPDNYWDSTVSNMLQKIKRGDIAGAFCEAIESCGGELSKHFPITATDKNELPDKLIVE
jgi:putative membrane protein